MDEREELRRILDEHGRRYPKMTPQDAVKLVYQNEFGGGHLIRDEGESLERLVGEWNALPQEKGRAPFEEIGGGMVRVMLTGENRENYPPEELNRDFARSAKAHRGSMPGFLAKLETVREETAAGRLPFPASALEEYLEGYVDAGCPAVSHSGEYRSAYRPAYRVVLRRFSLPLLLEELERRRGEGLLVALEGRCASGKTTLASGLSERYGFPVLHMDDFFLRTEQRTPARYAQPGGNVDYERFLEEVLLPLRQRGEAVYRPFDCGRMALGEKRRVKRGEVTVVEGTYSCHPALWDCYDLHVFLTVAPREQERRLLARNGPAGAAQFRERWIPLEEAYFSALDVESRCEYSLEVF